jgi:hypothetical protein
MIDARPGFLKRNQGSGIADSIRARLSTNRLGMNVMRVRFPFVGVVSAPVVAARRGGQEAPFEALLLLYPDAIFRRADVLASGGKRQDALRRRCPPPFVSNLVHAG